MKPYSERLPLHRQRRKTMSDFTLEDLFNYRRKGAGRLVDAYEQHC